MHNTSQFPHLRLAIAPGVPSPQLSDLLALQRTEEPEVSIAFFEVAGEELLEGLREGRYDVGMSFQGSSDSTLNTQSLWIENMAVAMPLRYPLLDQATLTIANLQDCPVFCWQAETCPLLEDRLAFPIMAEQSLQRVTSFEMMALWVAAGYGVGVSTQSRIERAKKWEITMRPLADGPYEIVTYLQRPRAQADSIADRFERRALKVASAGTA